MKYLGIDNGLDGGLVLLDSDGAIQECLVMPTIDNPNGKGRLVDAVTLSGWFRDWSEFTNIHVVLEKAQAMPGQGVVSMFSIGLSYGVMQGVVAALQLPVTLVHPKTWQKVMFADMAKQDTKAASVMVAQRLWPGQCWLATPKCKKPHDGLTDASLIAEWGRRTLGRPD